MDVKEKKPGRFEDQDEVEPQSSEDFLRYRDFASEEMVRQMQNAVAFDWEEDVNDPFEKVVARSGKASSKPVNEPTEISVARNREASSHTMDDPTETALARSGEASNKPMNDPTEISVVRSVEASRKPMNDPSEIAEAKSVEASSNPMNDSCEIDVARSGEASSKPMNDSCEVALARSGEASSTRNSLMGHIRTYRGHTQGQSNTHKLQGYIQQVRSCQDQEPLKERVNDTASKSNEAREDMCRTQNRNYTNSPRRGYDRRTRQQAWRYGNNSYEKYSPRDISDSQDKTNRCCDMNLTAFQEHPYETHHGKNYSVSPRRGQNRGSRRQPHLCSDISYEKQSLRDVSGMKSYCIKPWLLVEALAECPNFKATLMQLLEWKNMLPSAVREVVVANGDVFRVNGEVVELHPKISICQAHVVGPQGCQNPTVCKELHVCHIYVRGFCQKGNCTLGHRWYTDHNRSVFQNFYLERLPHQSLRYLMKGLMIAPGPIGQLDVCYDYNGKGCSRNDCGSLHVCRGISSGLSKCSIPRCKLNHNLLTADCCDLLRAHGLSTNETPQDVAIALLAAYPSLGSGGPTNQAGSTPPLSRDPLISGHPTKLPVPAPPQTQAPQVKGGPAVRAAVPAPPQTQAPQVRGGPAKQTVPRPPLAQAASTAGQTKKTTTALDQQQDSRVDDGGVISWLAQKVAHEFTFDTSNVQVFREALGINSKHLSDESKNSNPSERKKKSPPKGNTRIGKSEGSSKMNVKHSPSSKTTPVRKNQKCQTVWSHYLSGDTKINQICFHSVESICQYEESGCSKLHAVEHFHWQISEQANSWLNLRSYQVNQLERAFCNPAEDGVVIPHLDPAKLHSSVHYLLTVLGNDTWHANFQAMVLRNSDYSRILYLRRLCTEFIAGQKIAASIYHWFFLDINKKWVKYGKVDTAGETKLVSPITSDDIEKHFLRSQHTPLTFKNASYTYVLDFRTMTQTNQSTNVKREVRRRPEPHLKDNSLMSEQNASINGTYSDIRPTWDLMQPEERVRCVVMAVTSAEYQNVVSLLKGRISNTVIKIERIQNPFLWKALQNKIKEMTAVYGDINKVDVRHLFHGTRPDVVPSICAENFDWRLYGRSSGYSYGQGTYFSTDAATSFGYCKPDLAGLRYLFIARVAIGSLTRGSPAMSRPPINKATGAPFDSTGDGGTIIVKYDKQEYYPEYILTLK